MSIANSENVALGFPPWKQVIFLGPHKQIEEKIMVFDKIRNRADTLINDRVVAPTRTAVIISIAAFLIAGLALILAANKGGAS